MRVSVGTVFGEKMEQGDRNVVHLNKERTEKHWMMESETLQHIAIIPRRIATYHLRDKVSGENCTKVVFSLYCAPSISYLSLQKLVFLDLLHDLQTLFLHNML